MSYTEAELYSIFCKVIFYAFCFVLFIFVSAQRIKNKKVQPQPQPQPQPQIQQPKPQPQKLIVVSDACLISEELGMMMIEARESLCRLSEGCHRRSVIYKSFESLCRLQLLGEATDKLELQLRSLNIKENTLAFIIEVNVWWIQFSELLSEHPDLVDRMCKRFKKHPPTMCYTFVMKEFKEAFDIKTSPANFTADDKLDFLAFTFVSEFYVNDYFQRMQEHLGF